MRGRIRRITLPLNSTSSTTTHGFCRSSCAGVNTMAKPVWAPPPSCTRRMFPRTTTRRAFFSSKMFLTVHDMTLATRGPSSCRLSSTVMSLGMTPGMLMWAPPNMMFSPAASR